MKYLLALTLFMLLTYAGSGQQILFKETFDQMPGLNLNGGWTSKQSGAVGWRTSDMYNLYCSYSVVPQYKYWAKVAAISGCYGDKGGPRNNKDVFAYTKSINLSAVQGGVVLKYDSYFNRLNAYNKFEKATVEISVNDGASWTVIQDVPAGSAKDSFASWYINLSQYVGYGNVRIGFRYSDQGVDQKYGGWAIDDIILYRPAKNDLALAQFAPFDPAEAYTAINNTYVHTGKVVNMGLDTVHSFTVSYRRDNSYVLSQLFNIAIPPLGQYDITHNVPDTIATIGKVNITAWVSTAGDANTGNDTVHSMLNGVNFIPKKIVAVEAGTATWDQFGPRELVYMDALHYDNDACLVAVHTADPMGVEYYSDYFYNLNYYSGQFFLLDRKYVEPTELFSAFDRYKKHFGYADLVMHGGVYGANIEIGVTVKPAIDITGDFRLLLVITEDKVVGTGGVWDQKNGYAGGAMGTMGDYQNKPDPVPLKDVDYNYVARIITPSPGGDKSFATELKYNGNYYRKFKIPLEDNWDPNKLRAIAMLFRNDDTLILNSNQLSYFLSVAGSEKEQAFTGIYPNPANDFTTLEFDAKSRGKADITITDISGRTMAHIPAAETVVGVNKQRIPTGQLPDGLYIINVITNEARHSLKLKVMH
ncbi:MAG: T9SS type A sorting domain-containing protein [Chitinophagales bacterium]|nr:T9SS type A sorting domain-containing protein [Chitinophagales bacterium]